MVREESVYVALVRSLLRPKLQKKLVWYHLNTIVFQCLSLEPLLLI